MVELNQARRSLTRATAIACEAGQLARRRVSQGRAENRGHETAIAGGSIGLDRFGQNGKLAWTCALIVIQIFMC
jgi:hypothetical protein